MPWQNAGNEASRRLPTLPHVHLPDPGSLSEWVRLAALERKKNVEAALRPYPSTRVSRSTTPRFIASPSFFRSGR